MIIMPESGELRKQDATVLDPCPKYQPPLILCLGATIQPPARHVVILTVLRRRFSTLECCGEATEKDSLSVSETPIIRSVRVRVSLVVV